MPRNPDKWKANCAGCGVEFSPLRPKQRYHDRACAEEHRLDWANPKGGTKIAAGLEPRVCLNQDCPRKGAPFQPSRANQLTCSRPCRDSLPAQRERTRAADRHPERQERQNELRRPSSPRSSPARVESTRLYNRRIQLAKAGWTPEMYAAALARQNGGCRLCGRKPTLNGIRAASKLHADHDHKIKPPYPRELLCGTCNQGLGYFKDDPALLRRAAEYVERHRALAGGHR